ncbi:MAG: TonB-dependent receptor domain-containing protein [Candidatus Aminicenantaceae bacterium]
MVFGKRVFLAFLSILFFGAFLCAQVPTGQIFGTVTEEDGNPLPGVTVEATSPKLVGVASTVTDTDGVYRLFALTPGIYRITFTLMGFKTVIRDGIVVQIEQSVKLDIQMQMGELEEEVTVVGQTPLIDVKSTAKGMTMTKEMFEVLPRGRDFDTLVTAVPGVANEPLLAGISVDGASGAENMYYIDGTDITNIYYGDRGQGAAFEFVDEVQVKASGYKAEFGGSLGGVVNVITRQGGNEFHGELIGYYSGSKLTGKERDTLRLGLYDVNIAEYVNYQDLYGKDEIHRIEVGFSLGGYILKDRLWFFGSFLPIFQPTERHVKFEPSLTEGDYTRRDKYWNFQVKLTAQPFRFMRLGASFVNNFSKWKGGLPPQAGTGDPMDVWPDYGYSFPNWTASAHADFTFGNNVLLSLRGGSFYRNDWNDQLVQPTEPRWRHGGYGNSMYPDIPFEYIRPSGWENMAGGALWVTEKLLNQRSYINGDLFYYMNLAGEHAWKFGIQWVRTNEDVRDGYKYPDCPSVGLVWGRSLILWGQNYGIGKYGYYAVAGNEVTGPRGSFFKVHSDRWAIYLQDSWTIGDKLTLNLGVRTESEYIPNYSDNPDLKGVKPIEFNFGDKLAPRLGFIYDVSGDSSLKIFGSYGLYFDVMKLYFASHAFGGYKSKTAYYTLDTYEWDKIGINGNYPGTLLTVADWFRVDFTNVDPDLKPMSQQEFSLGVEKMLSENLSATVRLVQKHLRYAIEDTGVIVHGEGEMYYITNPGFGYSRHTTKGGKFDPKYPETPKAKREYWAVNFSLDKRLSDNWLAGFSYTWSRLTGNYSGLASSDERGRNSPNVERNYDNWLVTYDKNLDPLDGPLGTDRTHIFKFYGAYIFPFGLTVGTVINALSGTPFTERWAVLQIPLMPYNRGNLGRMPFLWFVNLYAEYNLKIGKTRLNFNVNVDNVFNVSTATTYWPFRTLYQLQVTEDQVLSKDWDLETSGYIPDPRFRKEDTFYPPISARLGVKFIF